jgi:type I restriction enzyme S subunit
MTNQPRLRKTGKFVTDAGIAAANLEVLSAGTLLFAMYASLGTTSVLQVPATTNQAILGLKPSSGTDVRFLEYWLGALRPSLSAYSRSNTQDNLNAEVFGNLPFPTAGGQKQRKIAGFLDRETERIDALVDKKRRLTEVLEERYQTWLRSQLGELSTQVLPLKRRWRVIDCKHRTPSYVAGNGFPVVSPGDVEPGRLDLDRAHRFVDETDYLDLTDGGRKPRRGDIIYSRNATIGIAAYVDTDRPFCMGQDVCLITSEDEDQLYLSYVLNSIGVDQLEVEKLGTTFSRINVAQILELRVPAPDPSHQRELSSKFDRERQRMDRLASSLACQVDLLAEYREALITAAVTGEIDVDTFDNDRNMEEATA